jgi:hypothetical protein
MDDGECPRPALPNQSSQSVSGGQYRYSESAIEHAEVAPTSLTGLELLQVVM